MEDLRQRRLDARLSQAEVARRAGTTQANISLMERGERRITWKMRKRLEAALDSAGRGTLGQYNKYDMREAERATMHRMWLERYGS